MMLVALFAILLILLALRVPVYMALLAISLVYVLFEEKALSLIVQRLTSGLESFPLVAVPLFVLAGSIMAGGGLAEKLMGFAGTLVGQFKGGLAQVNVLNSFLVGGMSGSAQADAAIDSKVLVPIMRREGYSNAYASALTAASSSISPILPPSIGLILYGVLANVSIGALFIAGVFPALLIAIALSIAVRILAQVHNHTKAREERASFREIMVGLRGSIAALMMPILLLVGLRIGVFTPTELSAVAVIYALLVSIFVYKQMTWRDVPRILRDSALMSAMLMLIIAGAAVFSIIVAYEKVPDKLASLLSIVGDNPYAFLLLVNIILLLLGAVIDAMSLMIIMTPMLAPLAVEFGIDPVQFGVIVVLNVTIGSITPPVGSTLFTVSAITGAKIGEITKAFMPFFLTLLAVLLLVSYVPFFTTWLPSVL
ncbi:MAG TPA: TRAP transporter large permease [Microbacteriaceae bacterium]|nr:TRAP transporter large permease [Microbacteriaceae bacterium]